MKKLREISYVGDPIGKETEKEREHRKLSALAAAEGMVLLENNGALPLKERGKIALFGAGARHTATGGTGSGDVHERYSVNIEQGLINAGFTVTTGKWLDAYDRAEEQCKRQHYTDIYTRAVKMSKEEDMELDQCLVQIYLNSPGYVPVPGSVPTMEDLEESDGKTVIYVLVRNAGEGKDRRNIPGDYQLTEEEKESLYFLRRHFETLIVLVNCGGLMDLSFLDNCGVDALLFIHQPGMEAGTAAASILTGEMSPSGKLTDTWPMEYTDFPNSDTFSHMSKDTSREYYQEGIYVGYRYFDKAGIRPRYCFGYGKSYTEFSWTTDKITIDKNSVSVSVKIKNTGAIYRGREVIQLYVQLPSGKIPKEEKRLVAFAKTKILSPGEEQCLVMKFQISSCASFDEKAGAYVLEAGHYGIMPGNASDTAVPAAYLFLERDIVVRCVRHICGRTEELHEIVLPERQREPAEDIPVFKVQADVLQEEISERLFSDETGKGTQHFEETEEERRILDAMSGEQMAVLVCGRQSGSSFQSNIGVSAAVVPGAAGETTSDFAREPWNLANLILADGPAGIRILSYYQLDPEGKLYPMNVIERFFGPQPREEGTDYYQYCTRIPSGTMLAQTFDLELMENIGNLIGEEMETFHINLWLAPGMNIHRNPLCGRNFEYYSEDPYLTGKMAAAVTRGVQKHPGIGTTIKHFACNNQEDNRLHCDSILSERALREIYLRGFEIAVTEAQPMAVMSSYNLVNGIHTANSYDLLTEVLRKEWGFQGIVMTDWNTTGDGGSMAECCISAGNDLIMPGAKRDVDEIIESLHDKRLSYAELRLCAARMVRTILHSDRYE